MFRNAWLVFLTIGLFAGLASCKKNCGPSDEPRLNLYLNMEASRKLTSVYGLNTVPGSPVIAPPQSSSALDQTYLGRTYWQLDLPLSLTADRTQYVFARSGKLDTVTVRYRRIYAYEDTECGYTITILPPLASNGQPTSNSLIVSTTTGKTEYVEFTPTRTRVLFNNPGSNTGITVRLLWPW